MTKSFKFAENGKRDVHGVEREFDIALEKLENHSKWDYDNNRIAVLEYIKACKRGQAKSNGKNKKVSKAWLYRLLGMLRMLSEDWLKKDFDKATDKDWLAFYNDMEDNVIKAKGGKNYKQGSKSKTYKSIRKFLKFRYGENKFYPKYCEDWVTTEEKVTREYIDRSEVERMVQASATLKTKTILMMLFDGGFRIEELLNLRWVDCKKPEGKEYYRAHIRPETSKTKEERHVSLWLATDLIDSYKNSRKNKLKTEFKTSDYLFDSDYQAMYKLVSKVGKNVLNKKISPHIMRHSSATYYSSVIKTYAQFCTRYGWKLNSGIAQRYFHAVSDDEIADQSKDHEIARFKVAFEQTQVKLKQQSQQMENQKKHLARQMEEMKIQLKEEFKVEMKKQILEEINKK